MKLKNTISAVPVIAKYSRRVYAAFLSLRGVAVAVILLFSANLYAAFTGDFSQSGGAVYDGTSDDTAFKIAVDTISGGGPYIYVVGGSSNGVSDYDYFTIKYNASGVMLASATYNSGYSDYAYDVAVDNSGNVYVTGQSYNGANGDYFTIKYNSNLVVQASATYNSGALDWARGVAIDNNSGNVYVTGYSYNGANDDYFTIKYNSSLAVISSATYNGGGMDEAYSVTVDSSGNVYVTGEKSQNYYTIKYDPSFNVIQSATYSGVGDDKPFGIAVANSGNVYVAGESYNGINYDYFTIKYNSSLAVLSSATYNSGVQDYGYDLAVDGSDNVYITGNSNNNFFTIKYNSNLVVQSSATYNSGNTDSAVGIAVDNSGYAYVAGYSGNGSNNDFRTIRYQLPNAGGGGGIFTGDFSQAGGSVYDGTGDDVAYDVAVDTFSGGGPYIYVTGYSSNGASGYDYFTVKYNASGVMIASSTYNGPANKDDHAIGVAVDSSGNVYVTGWINNGANGDYFTIKYNSSLQVLSSATYNGGAALGDFALDAAVDSSGNVYVAGYSHNGANYDYFIIKYNSSLTSVISSATYNGGGDDNAHRLAIDNSGNVYVTGYSNQNYYTIKYNSSLSSVLNSATYNSGGWDDAEGIAIDNSGNVFVSGTATNGANKNYFTIKYDSSLNVISSVTYNSGNIDEGYGVAVDNSGNVYVTGASNNGANYDDVTIKYNNSLVFQSSAVYNGGYSDYMFSAAVDNSGNVYVTGNSNNGTNTDFRTIRYQLPSDITLPAVIDNQPGDDIVRNAAGKTYNVDFFDAGNLDTVQYKVCSLPAQTGTVIKDWTNIAANINATSYNTDWQVDFNLLWNLGTTNYISVRAWDVSGNTSTVNDVFYVMKDTVPPTSSIVSPGDASNIQTLTYISGVVSDNYGINKVELQIKRLSDNYSWNGSDWQSGASIWIQASNNVWQYYGFTDAALTVGTSYWVVSRASDTAGNVEVPLSGNTFTYKTKKTIANGNWTNSATWFGGQQPLDGDAVFLKPGWTVTLNAGTSNLYSLTIESGAKLDSPTPYMVNIASGSGGGLYNYGTLANIAGTLYIGGASGNKIYLSTANAQCFGSMFINAASSVTLQSDITVGYLDIAVGGILDANTRQMIVSGTWQQNGTFLAGTSTVTFTGTSNQLIQGSTTPKIFANFAVNSSSTVNPTGPLDINGNFTIQTGTFVAGNFEHFISGNFVRANSGGNGFSAQTSTITFDGTGAQTVSVLPGTSFNNFTYSGTGSLTPLSNLKITGNFTESVGIFNCGNYTYNIGGNLMNNIGWNLGGNSTFVFDGPSPQTLLNAINFDNVIVKNPTKVVYSADTLSQIKNLSIDPGCSFDSSALGMLEILGNFTSSGTFVHGGSFTRFGLSGNGTIWTVANSTFNNVIINKTTATDRIDALTNLSIGGTLEIYSGILNMLKSSSTVEGSTTIDGSYAKLDIGSSTTTLAGNVQVLNGGTLLLPITSPPPILKLGGALTVDSGGFFVSQSSFNRVTSLNPGVQFYSFDILAGTLNVTGLTFEWVNANGMRIGSAAMIPALNNINFQSLQAGATALNLLHSVIPGTFTFTGHNFEYSPSDTKNVAAPYLASGLVVMQNAIGSKAGPFYENDPNDRVFWQPGDSISVVKPVGGETFVVGASTTISWNTAGSIKNVQLEYSKDNFATAGIFIANVSTGPNFGSYNWIIPDNSSPTVKVRISAANYSTDINAMSNAFVIQAPAAAPSNLKISLMGTTSIQWNFTDNASDETDLYISSGPNVTMRLSGNLGLLSGTGGTTSWWEINLSTNTQYTRYAEARNTIGSSWSAMLSSYTATAVPTGTKLIARSSYSVELDWQPNGNPEPGTYYGVWCSTSPTFSPLTVFAVSTSAAIGSNLMSGELYYFKVRSQNGDSIDSDFDITLSTKTLDGVAPTVSITEPADGSYKNYASIFSAFYGPVSDNVAVSSAVISMRVSGGNYTSGPAFDSVAPVWFDCAVHPSSWTYQPTPSDILISGTMYVMEVKAVDSSGNWSLVATSSCTYDNTMPVSAVVSPVNNSIINSLTTISGTASDNVGLQGVNIQIQRISDGSYWNGSAWSTATWLTATGTSAWSYTGLTAADLTNGTSYQIVSRATDFAVNIETITIGSVIFTYKLTVIAPVAPTGLTATEVTNSSIKWVWTDVANEQGYYLQTSTGGFVASVSADTVNYSETGILPNTQYSRYVEAYNAGGISTSTVVSKYTLAASPATFVVSAKDYNFVSLSWSANGNPAGTNYELQYSTASDFSIYSSSISQSLNLLISGLSQLTTYYYRLYSINAESIKTGPATVTVQTLNSVIKGPVSGKVTQSDGTAILGVLVQLYNSEGTVKIGETTTKSDGTYLFENIDDGLYRVICSWLVNEIESVVYKTDIPENSKDILFTLEIQYQLAQLAGKIALGSRANFVSGKFAPAQQPYVELLQRGRVIAKIDADTAGNYAIPNLLPGKYVARAFNGVQMSEPSEIKVKEGEKVMLNFRWALGLANDNVYAYPNPTKTENITIKYSLPNLNHTAKLRLYNIAGELVREVKDGEIVKNASSSGGCKFIWNLKNEDGGDVASGVYIYVLDLEETDTGEKATVKKKLAIIK